MHVTSPRPCLCFLTCEKGTEDSAVCFVGKHHPADPSPSSILPCNSSRWSPRQDHRPRLLSPVFVLSPVQNSLLLLCGAKHHPSFCLCLRQSDLPVYPFYFLRQDICMLARNKGGHSEKLPSFTWLSLPTIPCPSCQHCYQCLCPSRDNVCIS